MTDHEGPVSIDDIVGGAAASKLGPGAIPTAALLIVETVTESGRELQYLRPAGVTTWQALGMLRSITLALEALDVAEWGPSEDDE